MSEQQQFVLQDFDDYPNLQDENMTLEDVFGLILATIEPFDSKFVKAMVNMWNRKHVYGKRRYIWIAIRHYQFLAMAYPESQGNWDRINFAEEILALSKSVH